MAPSWLSGNVVSSLLALMTSVSSVDCSCLVCLQGTPWAAQHVAASCPHLAIDSATSFVSTALAYILSEELSEEGMALFPTSIWSM